MPNIKYFDFKNLETNKSCDKGKKQTNPFFAKNKFLLQILRKEQRLIRLGFVFMSKTVKKMSNFVWRGAINYGLFSYKTSKIQRIFFALTLVCLKK